MSKENEGGTYYLYAAKNMETPLSLFKNLIIPLGSIFNNFLQGKR